MWKCRVRPELLTDSRLSRWLLLFQPYMAFGQFMPQHNPVVSGQELLSLLKIKEQQCLIRECRESACTNPSTSSCFYRISLRQNLIPLFPRWKPFNDFHIVFRSNQNSLVWCHKVIENLMLAYFFTLLSHHALPHLYIIILVLHPSCLSTLMIWNTTPCWA